MGSKQLTLEAIGRMAGVSRATVSRVINNYPHIRPEVRARVQQVIDETGYTPNLAARTLASSQSNIIGLVIPHVMEDIFSDPYYSLLTQGIASVCYKHDYTLSLFLLHTKEEEDKALQRILGTGFVDGLMLTADPSDSRLSQQIASKQLPFVQLGRPQIDTISVVDVNNQEAAVEATTHLITLGYQRIAYIGSAENTAGFDRTAGYRQALEAHNRPWDAALEAVGHFSEAWGHEAMQGLLALQPDAVFAASDRIAMGAMQAITEAGLSIPEDVAIVGFDDIPAAARLAPPLTTIRQPIKQSGMAAAEMLFDILENGPLPIRHVVLPTELVIRESCGSGR